MASYILLSIYKHTVIFSHLFKFMPDVNKLSGSTTSLKGLSPVPEESETDICKESGGG